MSKVKQNYQKVLEQTLKKIEGQEKTPTLLLHSCCAPCSTYVIEYLSNYFYITVFFYNPNIDQADEYYKRAQEQQKLISEMNTQYPVDFFEGEYKVEESNLEKYEMVRREFDNSGGDYLKWDEYEDCVDKYSSVFVRKGGYIVKGDYLDYKPIKNPWMEEASSNSVFVTLKYDRGEAFGNILTPGDRVKVNVSYSAEDEASHDIFSGAVTRIKIKNLFEDIMITDLLNSKGNSIYDYYTDVLNLPLAEREALLRDENFLNNVAPVSMILEIDKDEEFRTYSELKNLTGVKYTFGLHPRQEGDIVIDQFKDLTRQITQNQTQMQSQQGDDK